MKITTYKGSISEWDIVTANVSILAEERLISEETYRNLKEADRRDRNVMIGTIMRDLREQDNYDLVSEFDGYIKKYVNMFIEENGIKKNNILEIAKDAVFLHNFNPKYTKFGDFIKFKRKHTYYYHIVFPATEKSGNFLKLYKDNTGVKLRGGTINKEHKAYDYLDRLMSDCVNNNTKRYIKNLSMFTKIMNSSEEELISGISNSHLVSVMKEVWNMM